MGRLLLVSGTVPNAIKLAVSEIAAVEENHAVLPVLPLQKIAW
jgi:hypothetical protein